MLCKEWCELVERYRAAVNVYNDAANALSDSPGTTFTDKWQRAERARTKCSRDRADLLDHEHAHGCLESHQPSRNRQTNRSIVVDQ
jgi:hypothetical protein